MEVKARGIFLDHGHVFPRKPLPTSSEYDRGIELVTRPAFVAGVIIVILPGTYQKS